MTHERNDGNVVDKDEARTPYSLFKQLDDRFHFGVDIAATHSNHLCDAYFSKDNVAGDALSIVDWVGSTPERRKPFFGNPPYSRGMINKFCKKAYEESLKGATVVLLLPSDTSTKYFHDYCMQASEIIFITSRVHFNHPDGTPFTTAPKFGSMVVIFKQEIFDGSPVIGSMGWK